MKGLFIEIIHIQM